MKATTVVDLHNDVSVIHDKLSCVYTGWSVFTPRCNTGS